MRRGHRTTSSERSELLVVMCRSLMSFSDVMCRFLMSRDILHCHVMSCDVLHCHVMSWMSSGVL